MSTNTNTTFPTDADYAAHAAECESYFYKSLDEIPIGSTVRVIDRRDIFCLVGKFERVESVYGSFYRVVATRDVHAEIKKSTKIREICKPNPNDSNWVSEITIELEH